MTVITINSITGNVVNTPNCGADRTYAFYRTLEEKQRVEAMWEQAGFVPVSYEVAPESFHASGRIGLMCMRRMTLQELGQEHMWPRDSVITEGGSI